MRPKVSVVIPVYNVQDYLRRCVDSLLGQTLSDIEVILVDDGSTDDSGKIADRYAEADPRVRVLHVPNKGPADARHIGVGASEGEYICFCDSDDYRPADALQLLYDAAQQEDADLVTSDFWISKAVNSEGFAHYRRPALGGTDPVTVLKAWFGGSLTGGLWSVFFKKSLYTGNIRDYLSVYYGEDGVVLLQLLYRARKIVQVRVPTYYYILRHGSLSNFERQWSLEWMETYALVTRWKLDYVSAMPEKDQMEEELAYFFLYRLSILLLRGEGRAFKIYGVDQEIYDEYYPVVSARARLRKLWFKQWVYLTAEKNGSVRLLKKTLWGNKLAARVVRTVKKMSAGLKKIRWSGHKHQVTRTGEDLSGKSLFSGGAFCAG